MATKKNTPPEGKFIGTVKVGTKGQIVIPKGARELFHIEPGDTLLVLADVNQGIAILRNDSYMDYIDHVLRAQNQTEEVEE